MALTLTGTFTILNQAQFDELAPDGGPLHFRDTQAGYVNPLTMLPTGQQARQIIAAQAATHGWPLTGIYFSSSGGVLPHFAVHVSEFPVQTGPQSQRADKLQTALLDALEFVYKNEQVVTDPTDPDFGQTTSSRNFWPQVHVWNYPALVPRSVIGVGDYQLAAFTDAPPGNWWQEF